MITRAIEKCFEKARRENWDRTFWAVDIHDTMLRGNYEKEGIPTQWFPFAKEAMQLISKRKDVDLILYTCCWPDEIEEYKEMFEENNIHFKYVNKNPDVGNTTYGNYEEKPYFNVLFEDKSGFDPLEWSYIIDLLDYYPDGYGQLSDADLKKHRDNIETHRPISK
jgi:hypothetical protein